MPHVLALDASGLPRKWISTEDAIVYQAKQMVVWSLGEIVATYRGGCRKDGSISTLSTPSIIAVRGKGFSIEKAGKVSLTNKTLFARDRYTCAYCGSTHSISGLSRDHILPRSKGGKDSWTNCVTACMKCNHTKSDSTIQEAGLELLYVPYAPNHFENLILQNRNILADQMDYLLSGVPKGSRVLC